MRKLGFMIVLILFLLSGCQSSSESINELSSRMSDFENKGNQFKIEMTIDLDITQNNQKESVKESITVLTQKDPYYVEFTAGDIKEVQYIHNNSLRTYTLDNSFVVNGLQLYEVNSVSLDSIDNPLDNLEFDLSKVEVKKITRNRYKINGKLDDFMPESMKKDLKDVLIGSGISEEEFNDISIEMLFKFTKDTFEYVISMDFDILDIKLEIVMSAVCSHHSFQLLDLGDDTKFYPMSSRESEIPIDINKPIVFTNNKYYISQYYAYFEAGNYGVYTNHLEEEYHHIQISSNDFDTSQLRVFKDVYNWYENNPRNIQHFYSIPTDGYYTITIDYPISSEPYILEVSKIESETDGIETTSYIVSENGLFDYEIESAYDFISFDFDLTTNAYISIVDSNQNMLYFESANPPYFTSVQLPPEGFSYFTTTINPIVYLHNPNGASSGVVTIEITPVVHAMNPDDSMLMMSDQFTDELMVTDEHIPNQFIAFEVTERKRYTFEYLMSSGDIEDGKGALFRSNGTFVCSIKNNHSISLIPGSYYYRSSNHYDTVYSIRYQVSDFIGTTHQIDSLQSYDKLTGNLFSFPRYEGQIQHLGEFIEYKFTLFHTTDVLFYQNERFELYDSMNNRVDILQQVNKFVYRLQPGDYFVTVNPPSYYTADNFPVDYLLILYEFTGGGADTSVYPFVEEVPIGFYLTESTMDYTGDYDGYNFTLEKTSTVHIFSTETAQLIRNNRIIYSNVGGGQITLEAGTYTIMCRSYEPIWTVAVRIISP